jgi:hypothetical protein
MFLILPHESVVENTVIARSLTSTVQVVDDAKLKSPIK